MSTHPEEGSDSGTSLELLCQEAKTEGWQAALYHFYRSRVLAETGPYEDERWADWRFLLPLRPDMRVLLFGAGLGAVPAALAETCREVHVVEPDPLRIAFVRLRCQQLGLEKISLYHLPKIDEHSTHWGDFDLVAAPAGLWPDSGVSVPVLARIASACLKPSGLLFLGCANRWSLQRLLRNGTAASDARSFFGYRRLLSGAGFADMQFYAPLPRHDQMALFHLSLSDAGAMQYFVRSILPLVLTVSPEVRSSYRWEMALARLVLRLAPMAGLAGLARFFVPGFAIAAKKAGS